LNLSVDNVRVWDFHNDTRYKLLNDGYSKLDACQILDKQSILLEEKDPQTGRFNEERKGYSSSHHSSQPSQPGKILFCFFLKKKYIYINIFFFSFL